MGKFLRNRLLTPTQMYVVETTLSICFYYVNYFNFILYMEKHCYIIEQTKVVQQIFKQK